MMIYYFTWHGFAHLQRREGMLLCFCPSLCRLVPNSFNSFFWRGCTYWNRFITVISRPSLILGTLSNCWRSYAPWTWKHSFYLQFPCIFAAEVTYTGKNLVYRFIIMIYVFRSSSIFGKIKQLLVELCPLDLKKLQLFAVTVHFLCRSLQGRVQKCFTPLVIFSELLSGIHQTVRSSAKFSHFWLLQKNWANTNETWRKSSLSKGIQVF